MSMGQSGIVRRETDEQRGFREGLKYSRMRQAVIEYKRRENDMHRKLAYIYRGDVPPQVAFLKQGLDYWRGMALFALRPPSKISLYQYCMLKMVEILNALDGFCNVPEVMVNKSLEGYPAFAETDGVPAGGGLDSIPEPDGGDTK